MKYSVSTSFLLLVLSTVFISHAARAGEETPDEHWKNLCIKATALQREEKYDEVIELLHPPLKRIIPEQVDSKLAITALCLLAIACQESNKFVEADDCFGLAVRTVDHELLTSLWLKNWAGDIYLFAARYYIARGKNLEALKCIKSIKLFIREVSNDILACRIKLYESYLKFAFGYIKASADLVEECLIECQGKINDQKIGGKALQVYLSAIAHQRLLSLAWAPSARNFRDHSSNLTLEINNPQQTALVLTMGSNKFSIEWQDAVGIANFIENDPIRSLIVSNLRLKEIKSGLANVQITNLYLDLALTSLVATKRGERFKIMEVSRLLDHGQQIVEDNNILMSYNAMAFLWLKYRLYDLDQLPSKVFYLQAIEKLMIASNALREQAGLTGEPDILNALVSP